MPKGFLPCWPSAPGLSIRELKALSPTQETWKPQKRLTFIFTSCTKISQAPVCGGDHGMVAAPTASLGLPTPLQELSLKGTKLSICSSCALLALLKYLLKHWSWYKGRPGTAGQHTLPQTWPGFMAPADVPDFQAGKFLGHLPALLSPPCKALLSWCLETAR